MNGTGIKRICRALSCSTKGLQSALRYEKAFYQELFFVAIMSPIGLWIGDNGVERGILTGCLFLILIAELLNSAIETAVDRIGTEYHELSGRAKDLGSAAVFLAFLNGMCIWLLVLFG
ncbi:MAG: diacylglycerol kinase [Candidatus Electrothrix sp. AR4]|nr:diacylglycerol kinase [Candidatus Electrothrix sp. AR4]